MELYTELWMIWLIVAALLVIVELLTQWVSTFCLAVGALAALVAALIGCSLTWQLVWLAIGTVAGFVCFMPMFKKRLERRQAAQTGGVSNMDALIGRQARVIVAIKAGGVGRVRIDGDNWQATAPVDLPLGAVVKVDAYDSIILSVSPIDK